MRCIAYACKRKLCLLLRAVGIVGEFERIYELLRISSCNAEVVLLQDNRSCVLASAKNAFILLLNGDEIARHKFF